MVEPLQQITVVLAVSIQFEPWFMSDYLTPSQTESRRRSRGRFILLVKFGTGEVNISARFRIEWGESPEADISRRSVPSSTRPKQRELGNRLSEDVYFSCLLLLKSWPSKKDPEIHGGGSGLWRARGGSADYRRDLCLAPNRSLLPPTTTIWFASGFLAPGGLHLCGKPCDELGLFLLYFAAPGVDLLDDKELEERPVADTPRLPPVCSLVVRKTSSFDSRLGIKQMATLFFGAPSAKSFRAMQLGGVIQSGHKTGLAPIPAFPLKLPLRWIFPAIRPQALATRSSFHSARIPEDCLVADGPRLLLMRSPSRVGSTSWFHSSLGATVIGFVDSSERESDNNGTSSGGWSAVAANEDHWRPFVATVARSIRAWAIALLRANIFSFAFASMNGHNVEKLAGSNPRYIAP
ncbi:hypothetical protein DFH06DRAFT_1299569 [Mycena polygramma]|nr:hypothetical protein DFH06DRAFT_1299569 [Mycena polygramma]